MERIKYIVSYDLESNKKENRLNILASTNKINYIISVLNDSGYAVDIISTSQTLNKKCYKGHRGRFGCNTIRWFPTTWRGRAVLKVINVLVMRFSILLYLLNSIKRNEKIIIYHSIGNLWMLPILKKIKKAFIIEEVEEIYGDIFNEPKTSKKEKKMLQCASAYIYPTKLLDNIVNKNNKPYVVVHGAYKDNSKDFFIDDVMDESSNFDKDIFHVGYTGILDPKKGCINILMSAKYLDSSFHIHLLGFGNAEEVDAVEKIVNEYRSNSTIKCKVSYDGVRRGKAYVKYLKKLNLGVCPVDASQDFINTQFPSKVITYLVSGLPVLCSEAKSVMSSDVADAIMFYKGNSPQHIANAIMEFKENQKLTDPTELIRQCDKNFRKHLLAIIKD